MNERKLNSNQLELSSCSISLSSQYHCYFTLAKKKEYRHHESSEEREEEEKKLEMNEIRVEKMLKL
jgi:hypothetical protein